MMVTATHNREDAAAGPSHAEPRTLFELFRQSSTKNPEAVAFRLKRNGSWTDVTWSEHATTVTGLAKGLLALGVTSGDCVAILSGTRLEWVQCDSAIVNIGAVTVGIYHSNLAPDCAFILKHAEVSVVFVEDDEQLQKVLEVRDELPGLRHVIVFDGDGDPSSSVLSWAQFLAGGEHVGAERLEQVGKAITPGDLASLVYTSGTTGEPKGAMITHENLVFVAHAASVALYIEPHFTTLLFLPLAHVFARMIVYMCQRSGLTVVFAEDLKMVAANLKEVRPHFIASVPRIYEKVHEKVVTAVEDAGGFKSMLFAWAVEVGRQAARLRLSGHPLPPWLALRYAVADRLVLHKVRDAFGGRLVWGVSGAAPLNTRINEFYHACGVTLIEGLGQTENTSLSNTNRINHNKIGTVGPTVPGVEMKLAADGEVLFRGPNNMKGYFKNPEATADTINAEGWLHSGDIGEIDEDGFLTITDRKKDLIITAGGKNVAPQRIERTLRTSRFISQVVACGDRRKFISALITLDAENTRQWAQDNGLESLGNEELARTSEVQELIEREIAERNGELASYESVKKFRILPRDLSIETGELTPTLKIKRKVVCEKYRALLEEMYDA